MLCTECNRHVRPVVALDIDGTLADYHGAFLAFAWRWLRGPQMPVEPDWLAYRGDGSLAQHMGITVDLYRQIKLAYRQGGGKRFQKPIPGAEDMIYMLHAVGAEVWFTTTRPYNKFDSTDPDTRAWMDWYDIRGEGLIYDDDKYGKLLEIIGPDRVVGVLDDQLDQFDRAEELGLHPLFMSTRYNEAFCREPFVDNLDEAAYELSTRARRWSNGS